MRKLSVCQTCELWQNGRKICPDFLYCTKDHLAWFSEKKNGWWGATLSTWNFGWTGPHWSEIADFKPIFARSASAITPSEKCSINTNRKSTTRFPISLRWTSYVASKPPKVGWKTQNGRLKEVCYKVSLCENCQRQSCKAFIGLTPRKIYWWERPGSNWPRWSEIADFRSLFARSDSAETSGEKKFN